jgi:hypothetical protein
MIVIQSNVPVPFSATEKSELRLAIEALEVGQSFAQPIEKLQHLRGHQSNVSSKFGRKFVTRTLPTGECRIWRKS